MQYQVCFFFNFSGDKVSEPVPEKSMNMLQKQSLNILCTIYQPFLKVYNFSLHIAVFHIRLTSFAFLTFLSLCEDWMFYNSLKNSPPLTSYVHSIYILCPEALCSVLFCKSGQLNSQNDR